MHRILPLLFASCLLLLSCSGGGAATPPAPTPEIPDPPAALTVTIIPTGSIGGEGEVLTFAAELSREVESVTWDFGGGATPNTSTALNPEVTLGAAGIYEGSLRVFDDGALQLTQHFVYRVVPLEQAIPHGAQIDTVGLWACDNKNVAFEARASGIGLSAIPGSSRRESSLASARTRLLGFIR